MGDTRLEPLALSEDERRTLENWVKRRSTAQGLVVRARIVLACAQGGSNLAVAARLGVSRHTAGKWRARFLRERLDGLPGEPRPGVPRTITDAQVEEVVVRTLEEVPEGATHWPERELAARVGISPSSVLRIWRAFGLQPWRTGTFKVSPDPLLIDKIRDVIGLYLAPPDGAAVFAVDEKPQIQALERTAPVLPMLPGVPERRSHDYIRHDTIDLFADFSGNIISVVPRQRILVVGGESYVSCTVKNPRLRDEAIRLSRALGLEGHNTIQCFLHEGRVKFIEVNARYGGAAALGFAAGANTPRDLVRLVQGKEVAPHIDDFRDGLYMLRYTEDRFLDRGSLTQQAYHR